VIGATPIADARATSPLGRTSPITKLGVAVVWLIGLAFTSAFLPPLVLVLSAVLGGWLLGRIAPLDFLRAVAPLWFVAGIVVLSNALLGAANTDPLAMEVLRIGPLRLTEEALRAAFGIGLRVVAIASVGAVFALTTEPTRLVDALVQQLHVSERFGYGALAAYQSIPRFADDLTTLRQARRMRGLRGDWHPRILINLLVLAIRHGDRVALSMDARGFGSGPRSRYREVPWTWLDGGVALGGLVILAIALWLATAPM